MIQLHGTDEWLHVLPIYITKLSHPYPASDFTWGAAETESETSWVLARHLCLDTGMVSDSLIIVIALSSHKACNMERDNENNINLWVMLTQHIRVEQFTTPHVILITSMVAGKYGWFVF